MSPDEIDAFLARTQVNADGLVPAVAQQWDTREVLMVAWTSLETLRETLSTGRAVYFSRSRGERWAQGRDVRACPVGPRGAPGLRRRHRAAARRPGRRGLPHRGSLLLRCLRRSCDGVGMTDFTGAVAPDLEAFRSLARERRVIPVVRRLLADGITAVGLFEALCGDRAGTFLLESAEQGRNWSRYSFIGVRCAAMLTQRDGEAVWLGRAPRGVQRRRQRRRRPARHDRPAAHDAAAGPAPADRRPGRLPDVRRRPRVGAGAGRQPRRAGRARRRLPAGH